MIATDSVILVITYHNSHCDITDIKPSKVPDAFSIRKLFSIRFIATFVVASLTRSVPASGGKGQLRDKFKL